MQIDDLQKLTVVQLRKIAKENKIKLSAGIDKEGIVNKLAEELSEESISVPSETPAVSALGGC